MRERLITTELQWHQEQVKLVWERWSFVGPVTGSAVLWARKSLNKNERVQVFLNMRDWAPSQILLFTKTAGRMTYTAKNAIFRLSKTHSHFCVTGSFYSVYWVQLLAKGVESQTQNREWKTLVLLSKRYKEYVYSKKLS